MKVWPALALALLLAPLAAADHVFSHRVYVVGRVIDSAGMPAPGVSINVSFTGISATSDCFDSKPLMTNATGDYEICRHTHRIPPNATATLVVEGQRRTVAIDPDLRHASASFQLDHPATAHDVNGERVFARTFTVTGRAFALLPDSEDAEGVRVNATPLTLNVSVVLRSGEHELSRANATPNEHGTYFAALPLVDVPQGMTVHVSAGREASEEIASGTFRRADLNVVHDLRLVDGPGKDAPGSRTPMPLWVAIVACIMGSAFARTRSRTR